MRICLLAMAFLIPTLSACHHDTPGDSDVSGALDGKINYPTLQVESMDPHPCVQQQEVWSCAVDIHAKGLFTGQAYVGAYIVELVSDQNGGWTLKQFSADGPDALRISADNEITEQAYKIRAMMPRIAPSSPVSVTGNN